VFDKSQALVLDALRQAMAEPAGVPLFAGKSLPGLFSGTAAGKQAAQLCRQEGYLTRLRTEPRGRGTVDVCAISEKGLAYLLKQFNPTPHLKLMVLFGLREWQSSGRPGDCPLPRLYHTVQEVAAGWTVGQFHDCLRSLHDEQKVYLHPWTGPLYEIPEPNLALLIGHEVAYYASLR
jgi:hypothetical protein